jgi:hemerythrin-like domain-containing protein
MVGIDAHARKAAKAVIRYFDTAAVHHHADEDEDLFPALRAVARGETRQRLVALMAVLTEEHRRMEAAWAALQPTVAAISQGEMADLTIEHAMAFDSLYDVHMAREERLVFPIAVRLLNADQIRAIGAAMTARRAPQAG